MKMLNALKDKAGYLSIETVIVAGIIIALGAWAFLAFYDTAEVQTNQALTRVNEVDGVQTEGLLIN